MEWYSYVGEMFEDEHGTRFHAEAYDNQHGFSLRNLKNQNDRMIVPVAELMQYYRMVIECNPTLIRSIANHSDGYHLLERVLFDLEAEMPAIEVRIAMRRQGYQEYDIYLALKAAELILQSKKMFKQ